LLKSVLRICAGSESESGSESALLRIFFAEISLADLVPDPNPDSNPELNPGLNPEPNPDSNLEPDPNIDPDP
jgi:hypothetical protein